MSTLDLGRVTTPEIMAIVALEEDALEQAVSIAVQEGMHRDHAYYILNKLAALYGTSTRRLAAFLVHETEQHITAIVTQPTETMPRIPRLMLPQKKGITS